MNTKAKFATLFFCSVLAFSSTTIFAGKNGAQEAIRTLPKKTITVGCNGKACHIPGGNGRLMYGFDHDAATILSTYIRAPFTPQEVKVNLQAMVNMINTRHETNKIHNHAGVTVDVLPKAEGSKGLHLHKDFFELSLNEASYEAVFFEQLPPTCAITSPADPKRAQEGDEFLPRAIEKARNAIMHDGKIIIQLALDTKINSKYTKEDLTKMRTNNPFVGYFDDVSQQLYTALQSEGQEGDEDMCKAIQFYARKIGKKSAKTVKDTVAIAGNMKDFTRKTLTEMFDNFLNFKNVTMADILYPNQLDKFDIASTIMKLMLPFKQGDMMIAYMNSHGFKDAKLEWLEADEHEFNKAAGWFLTATKDPAYQGSGYQVATSSSSTSVEK